MNADISHMDERELEVWARKHRELARHARRERYTAIAALIGLVLVLLLLFSGALSGGSGGGGVGPLMF